MGIIFNSFQEMAVKTGQSGVFNVGPVASCMVENDTLPLVSASYSSQVTRTTTPASSIDPALKTMLDQYTPSWGNALGERVTTLEQYVKQITQEIAATRNEMRQGFTEWRQS